MISNEYTDDDLFQNEINIGKELMNNIKDKNMTEENMTEEIENEEIVSKIYTEKEIHKMDINDILSIISITTVDGDVIYFDNVATIDPANVFLKYGEPIPISSYEKYEELRSKYERYILFKIVKDPTDQVASLLKHKIELIERNDIEMRAMREQFANEMSILRTDIKQELSIATDNMLQEMRSSIESLSTSAKKTNATVNDLVTNVNFKLDRIKANELNLVLDKLTRVTSLLADVVED